MGAVTSDSLLIVGAARRPGRPQASEPKSALTAWVPQTCHDRLAQLALKHDVSVSNVVCQVLERALRSGDISLQNK